MQTATRVGLVLLPGLMLAGCVPMGIMPPPEVVATQAAQEISEEQRLDVVVHVFDPGIPAALAGDEQALANQRIFPDIRKAEARYFAVLLRNALENSSQWGAVRVAPQGTRFVDVTVSGRIVTSSGANLVLIVNAHDATGRVWLENRRYVGFADAGNYKHDSAQEARDPFHNVYSKIANDLLAARGKLGTARLREVRQVVDMSFAADLAPQAYSDYLRRDGSPGPALMARAADPGPRAGQVRGSSSPRPPSIRVARLPARNDPVAQRVQSIREHDTKVIDTLDGYYVRFHEQMQQSYHDFRRTFHETEMAERARRGLHLPAGFGAPPPPMTGNAEAWRPSRLPGNAGAMPSSYAYALLAVSSGRAYAFAQQIRSFRADADAQVMDVETRSRQLASATEEQYSEWRWLLREYQAQDLALADIKP